MECIIFFEEIEKPFSMQHITLDNGLRIVVNRRPGQVVYCGLAVDAGTRDQLESESGMAHLIEHMSFKGTQHRRSWHIINRMEAVGGDLNAYTGKEHTVYYCATLRQHLSRAIDLLFDITLHSTYPQRELEREVEVVIDEIESYNDSPSELIYDDFDQLFFPNHPLGRNILGDAERLRQYRSEDLQSFVRRLYHPSRMVLFVLGDIDIKQVERMAHRLCQSEGDNLPQITREAPLSQCPVSNVQNDKHTHQSHVIIGCKAYALADERRLGLSLLNNILGGPGMNSRLNISLRERRGLVYTVESSMASYTDTGLWTTYFGCDHSDVERCLRLVRQELTRLCDAPLSSSQLEAAKRQLKGQVALSWENGENVAIGMGRRLLHLGQTQTLQQLCDNIDSLTSAQLWDIAQECFVPERMMTLVYK